MIVCLLHTPISGVAGGLFRRAPEVGEWASFTWNWTQDYDVGSRALSGTHEFDGTIVVRCVGKEVVDGKAHLWIECHHQSPSEEGADFESIFKLLVPEDVLVNGEPSLDGIRGWKLISQSGDEPLEFLAVNSGDDMRLMLWMLLGGNEPGAIEHRERSIEVDGRAYELTQSETGPLPLPAIENEDIVATAEATWWLSDELAFGVASIEITGSQVNRGIESESRMESRFDLIATGTDGISELPDSW